MCQTGFRISQMELEPINAHAFFVAVSLKNSDKFCRCPQLEVHISTRLVSDYDVD